MTEILLNIRTIRMMLMIINLIHEESEKTNDLVKTIYRIGKVDIDE